MHGGKTGLLYCLVNPNQIVDAMRFKLLVVRVAGTITHVTWLQPLFPGDFRLSDTLLE